MEDREHDLRDRLAPTVSAQGVDLVEVAIAPAGRGTVLRLVIHSGAGVGHAECARVTRAVGEVLDAGDEFPGAWTLEVSSPGTDRKFKSAREFEIFRGRPVRVVRLVGEDTEEVRGHCAGVRGDDVVVLGDDGGEIPIPWASVRKARLVPEPPGRAAGEGRER